MPAVIEGVYTAISLHGCWGVLPGQGIILNNGVTASAVFHTAFFPIAQIDANVSGARQYSEITLLSDTSAPGQVNQYGPAVFSTPTQPNFAVDVLGYSIWLNAATLGYALNKQWEISSSFLTSGTVASWNAGDKLRLQITPQGGGVNFLEILLNGTVIDSVIDNTLPAITTGYPSLYIRTLDFVGPAQTTLSRFAGGLF